MRLTGSRQRRCVGTQTRLLILFLLLLVCFKRLYDLRQDWLPWLSGRVQRAPRPYPDTSNLPVLAHSVIPVSDNTSLSPPSGKEKHGTAASAAEMTSNSQGPPQLLKSPWLTDAISRRVEAGRRSWARNSSFVESRSHGVVLFSTWVTRGYKRVIHDNVLRTWPLLSSHVTLLLFSDQASI